MKTENNLLNKKIIRKKLEELKESFACLAIEDINVSQEDRTFMRQMIEQGKAPEEITIEIRNRMNLAVH